MSRRDPAEDNSWLALLLTGCSVADLHLHRATLVDDARPGDQGVIEAEAERALRVHALLVERQRHSEELTVLNDLARRLSSLRDTGEVLQEVARQSRRLLAVDVAYIMLTRADGIARIEVVDGSIGSTLRGIELPPGAGLGGRVMESGTALWTEDYLSDDRLAHLAGVDEAAVDERLGGILGVPLMVGEDSIGVLLAADRSRRVFTDREVSLLASLASHAAVAIHNARIFKRLQEAASSLTQSNRRLQHSSEINRAAVDLHHQLTDTLVCGGGLAELAAGLAQAVGARIEVLDTHDVVLADSTPGAGDGDRDRRLRAALGSTPAAAYFADAGSATSVTGTCGSDHVVVAPITLRDGYAGCVVASRRVSFDDEVAVLVESGATALALALASERAVAEAERRASGELLTALLVGEADEPSIRRRARAAGVDLRAVRCVLVFDLTDADASNAVDLAARLVGDHAAWSAEHAGSLVLLVPGADAKTVRGRLDDLTGGAPPGVIGLADCTGGPRGVRLAYEEARKTAVVLMGLGRTRSCALASELGVYRNLFSQAGRDEIAGFVDATLGPLLEHDRAAGRDLTDTLAAYLDHAQHHARTCEQLHIHPNTLYARLARLTELLGPTWRTPDRCLDLQLALRLHRLTAKLSAS